MNVNQEVRLNLSAAGIPPRLSMPQGDANSRTIVATLWDGATPYSVPANAAVMVRFRKPDGTGGLYDATEAGTAVTASGNTVTAPVATQMLAVAGVVQAEIDIYGTGSGKAADRLATFRFAVEVAPSVYPDAQIISSDYYNILAADISAATAAAESAETSAGDAEAWAAGTRDGVAVTSSDPAYENNAKYYKEQARAITGDTAKESTSQLILSTLRGQRPKRYGFRIKNSEPNPNTRVEYLYDAEGMTPAGMNFSTGVFSYGSWADIWFVRDNHPCMVKSDGTVDYWLKDNDYAQKYTDGSASDVSNTAYDGNCFSAIPLIWVKRWQEGDYSYTVFCEERYDDGYFAYAHTDAQGRITPYLFYPAFRGSLVDGKLRSLKGQALNNSTATDAERTAAQANGSGYDILQWCDWQLLMDMCYIIGKSTDLQGTFGQGHTTGGTSAADLLTSGTLSDKGRFFGYSDTAHAVKVFHTEVCWGDRWERVVGCLQDHGVWKMKMTPEGSGYNLTGAGYDAVGETVAQTGADAAFGGWFSAARNTPQGLLPTALVGGNTTYYCDYHYINVSILSVPRVGGNCGDGSACGRYVAVYNVAGNAGWSLGASLSYKRPS